MSRNLIVGLTVLVVAGLGWILIRGVTAPPPPVIETAAPEAVAPVPAPEPVPEPDDVPAAGPDVPAAGPVETVPEAATDAAQDADPANREAEAAAEGTGAAIDGGDASPSQATKDPAAGVGDTASGAADPGTDPAGGAAEIVAGEADAASSPTAGSDGARAGEEPKVAIVIPAVPRREDLPGLLTPEGFEAAPLLAYVEQADLEEDLRAEMRAAIERAQADATEIPAAIAELRDGLDIE